MIKNISVKGLDEIERKLDASILLQPAIEEAKQTIVARIVERPGKGLGAKANTLQSEPRELGARVTTTLNRPRTTGSAWQRKNIGIVKSMAPRVIGKAIQRIESAWSA